MKRPPTLSHPRPLTPMTADHPPAANQFHHGGIISSAFAGGIDLLMEPRDGDDDRYGHDLLLRGLISNGEVHRGDMLFLRRVSPNM